MANIRKSFNFRSGLQVDNDNFVVNANGLVGIGTSVPSQYLLNVYGDARITGLTTANSIFLSNDLEVIGVTTVGFITSSDLIVSNDANIGGILTVSQIQIGNSQLVDNIIGYARTTFITDNNGIGINTTSKVGIGTTVTPGASDPQLRVLGNVDITGVTTITGNTTITGVTTITGDTTIGSGVTLTNTGNASYSGVVTATTFDGDIDATRLTTGTIPDGRFPAALPAISGAALTSLNGSNISSGTIAAARVDTLNQNTTGTAAGLTGTPDVILGVTTTGNLTAGSIVGTGLSVTSIGIGTATPANTFQQRATGATELQVTSDTASASVTVGREPGIANTNNAEFRYGGAVGFPYSTSQSLDLINYGTGNFNYYLSANNAGAAAGDYIWHKGSNSDQLMSLTRDGNLGIGITNPTHLLSVQGISTFTGRAHFDGDVTILGNLSLSLVTATLSGDVQDTASNTVVDVSEKLFLGNVDISSGISTFNNSEITKLGISTPPDASNILSACANQNDRFHITGDGNVGIKTTSTNTNIELDVNGDIQARHGLVIGPTTAPKCVVDMSGVVDIVADGASRATIAYMIPPRVTTTQRNALTDTGGNSLSSDEAGAMIYNTTDNKLQVWDGQSWNDCF